LGCAKARVARLRDQIAGLPELDARTGASKRCFLAELDRLSCPFDEHADPVHVTASGVIVSPCGTVLHRHKRLGLWLQPGGHIDRGETPWDAAVREVGEETGIVTAHLSGIPQLFHVDIHEGAKGHTHLDLRYLLYAGDVDCAPPAGESPDCRWFSWDDALAVADPGLVGALRLAKAMARAFFDGQVTDHELPSYSSRPITGDDPAMA
jgi:8-oxo-dGTP pyrophosphatase MutT (NUDIX family)